MCEGETRGTDYRDRLVHICRLKPGLDAKEISVSKESIIG